MHATKEQLLEILKDLTASVESGFTQGEIRIDNYDLTHYQLEGSYYSTKSRTTIKFPYSSRRVAQCGHEVNFGILGCSCD